MTVAWVAVVRVTVVRVAVVRVTVVRVAVAWVAVYLVLLNNYNRSNNSIKYDRLTINNEHTI